MAKPWITDLRLEVISRIKLGEAIEVRCGACGHHVKLRLLLDPRRKIHNIIAFSSHSAFVETIVDARRKTVRHPVLNPEPGMIVGPCRQSERRPGIRDLYRWRRLGVL